MKRWKIAGINFDHMHMGDLLRQAREHPQVDLVGICDEKPARMARAQAVFGDPAGSRLYRLPGLPGEDQTRSGAALPRHGGTRRWTERVAPYRTHVLVEKPFAATLAQADAMIAALVRTRRQLIINWPLRWYPSHVTAKRLVDEGLIGEVLQIHYYDGNRGPRGWGGQD